MTEDEMILAAAEAIRATKSDDYTERAANIAELAERLDALKAEQAAIDAEAAAAKARLHAPPADDFQIPRYATPSTDAWTPRDDHEIFAVGETPEADPVHYELPQDDDEFSNSARPNGALE